MVVKRQKVSIEVEMTTEGANRNLNKFGTSVKQAREETDDLAEAGGRASLQLKIMKARAQNAKDNLEKFAKAEGIAARKADKLAKATRRSEKPLSGMKQAFADISKRIRFDAVKAFELAAQGVLAVAAAVPKLADESLRIQGVFNSLPFAIAPAAKATEGLADNMTLATQAVMANRAGVATNAKEFANLASVAQRLALGSGRDVAETIERITQGLAKQERELLDELVVIPRMDDMFKKLAGRLGKTTSELSDQERNTEFTRVAMEKLTEAANGTSVSTEGMAGSISRARVEMENFKTSALGGGDGTITLAEGIKLLDNQLDINADKLRDNLALEFEVKDALAELGVETDEVFISTEQLAGALEKNQKIEAVRIVALAEANKLTREQVELGLNLIENTEQISEFGELVIEKNRERVMIEETLRISRELSAAAALEQAQLDVTNAENAVAIAKGAQEEQGIMNVLVDAEAEARIRVLELQGDQEGAAKGRRKLELAALRALGAEGAPRKHRGGGRKRDLAKEQAEQDRRNFKVRKDQINRIAVLETVRAKERFRREQELNPFSEENLQIQLSNVIDFESERAEIVFNARQREIDALKAAGLDPIEAARLEAEAATTLLTEQQAGADRAFEREIALAEFEGREFDAKMLRSEQEISQLQFQDQVEAEQHSVALARIEEKAREEEKAAQLKIRLQGIASNALENSVRAVALAAVNEGAAISTAVANVAFGIAKEHGLIALSEFSKATVAGLGGNIPLAAAHVAAGKQSLAVAATAGAIGGGLLALPNFRSAGGGGRGFGADALGPGAGGAGAPPTSSSTGPGSDIGGPVPLSPEQRQGVAQGAAAVSSGSGAQIIRITNNITTLGTPDEETMRKLNQASDRAGRKLGKLSIG